MDIRIARTDRAIEQAFMELRAQKPLEKIKVKELCDLACINKSTFYAHYQDIYALANAMEDEMVEVVVFINRVEAAMSKCISESDPSFDADVVRKIVLSFCVQGCYYTFTSYCGQMDEKRLVALLASIARAAQKIRM